MTTVLITIRAVRKGWNLTTLMSAGYACLVLDLIIVSLVIFFVPQLF